MWYFAIIVQRFKPSHWGTVSVMPINHQSVKCVKNYWTLGQVTNRCVIVCFSAHKWQQSCSLNLVKCNLTTGKLTTTSLAVKRSTSLAVKQSMSLAVKRFMSLAVKRFTNLTVKRFTSLAVKQSSSLAVKQFVSLAAKQFVSLVLKRPTSSAGIQRSIP